MKASPIIVNWHAENAPIYSADFQPHGKGRLATAGGDNNVRLWKIEAEGEDRKVEYICTLKKHTQAVNGMSAGPGFCGTSNHLISTPANTNSCKMESQRRYAGICW